MTGPVATGSDLVVAVLREFDGQASRRTVLDVLAQTRSYREATAAVALAEVLGRVERAIGPDGRLSLKLTPQDAER